MKAANCIVKVVPSLPIAVCQKSAEDLNEWMVSQGHAIAYRRYSSDYVQAEAAAKAAKRNIWAGLFTSPAMWRRGEHTMDMGFAAPGGPDTVRSLPLPSGAER